MEFNITRLDKVLLIQTLYAHSSPIGLGQAEYDLRDFRNELVSGVPIDECKSILAFAERNGPHTRVLDYLNGKPIKLNFFQKNNGEIITDASSYDERNGKFRFLEALLNVFDMNEILIIKKGYDSITREYLDNKAPKRPTDKLLELMSLLKHTIKYKDEKGSYWKFDERQVQYKPPFM